MRKFRLKMTKKTVIALYALIILWIAMIGASICKWLGLFGFISTNLLGEIFAVLFALIFIIFLFKLRFLCYTITKETISLSLFGIKLTKIDINAIWKILITPDSLVVCHTVNNTETTITNIMINKEDFLDFGETAKTFNDRIIVTENIFDTFDDDDKEE